MKTPCLLQIFFLSLLASGFCSGLLVVFTLPRLLSFSTSSSSFLLCMWSCGSDRWTDGMSEALCADQSPAQEIGELDGGHCDGDRCLCKVLRKRKREEETALILSHWFHRSSLKWRYSCLSVSSSRALFQISHVANYSCHQLPVFKQRCVILCGLESQVKARFARLMSAHAASSLKFIL